MPLHRFTDSALDAGVAALEEEGERVVCVAPDGFGWVVVTERMILLEVDTIDEYR